MDREIKCVVRIPEGFEPSREDVERLKRDVWDSMIERLGEMLLAGEPKRPFLPEGLIADLSYCPTAARGVIDGIGDRALRHLSLLSGIEVADANTSDESTWC